MNFNYDELYFLKVGAGRLVPSKVEHAEGQDPAEWMSSELKNKPAKVICNGLIIGEIKGYDPKTEILEIDYFDKPIPVLTRDEWLKITGSE